MAFCRSPRPLGRRSCPAPDPAFGLASLGSAPFGVAVLRPASHLAVAFGLAFWPGSAWPRASRRPSAAAFLPGYAWCHASSLVFCRYLPVAAFCLASRPGFAWRLHFWLDRSCSRLSALAFCGLRFPLAFRSASARCSTLGLLPCSATFWLGSAWPTWGRNSTPCRAPAYAFRSAFWPLPFGAGLTRPSLPVATSRSPPSACPCGLAFWLSSSSRSATPLGLGCLLPGLLVALLAWPSAALRAGLLAASSMVSAWHALYAWLSGCLLLTFRAGLTRPSLPS